MEGGVFGLDGLLGGLGVVAVGEGHHGLVLVAVVLAHVAALHL